MNLIIENGGKPMVMKDGNAVPDYGLWQKKDLITKAKRLIVSEDVEGMVSLLSAGTPVTHEIVKMCKESRWNAPLDKVMDASLSEMKKDLQKRTKEAADKMSLLAKRNHPVKTSANSTARKKATLKN